MQTIIVADSHNLFREALCSYLRYAEPSLQIEDVVDYASLIDKIRKMSPNLVLIESALPGWTGNSADLAEITQYEVKLGLLVPILQTGITPISDIQGVFPKSLSCKAFIQGISMILEGQTFFPSLVDNFSALDPLAAGHNQIKDFHLTAREKEVLSFLAKGASNKDIARALDLQVVTVKLHVRGICRKMKVSNRTQAALLAKENGWG